MHIGKQGSTKRGVLSSRALLSSLAFGLLTLGCGAEQELEGAAPVESSTEPLGVSIASWFPVGPAVQQNGFARSLLSYSTPTIVGNTSGATNIVVGHPTDVNTLYVGTVNGGIWRTQNATADFPFWQPLTDFRTSLSTCTLAMDATNPLTLVAGTGACSNFHGFSHPAFGLIYRTDDGGDNWTTIDDPAVRNQNLSSVHVRGTRILASSFDGSIVRSAGGGAFALSMTGIPAAGAVYSMIADNSTPNVNRFYAAVRGQGIFLSENDGQSWTLASNGIVHTMMLTPTLEMVKLAVSKGRVFVAFAIAGETSFVGYTVNKGFNWNAMDPPRFPPGSAADPRVPVAPSPIQSITGAAGQPIVITTTGNHGLALDLDLRKFRVNIAGVTGNPLQGGVNINADWIPTRILDGMGQLVPNQFQLFDPVTVTTATSNGTAATGGTWLRWFGPQPVHQTGNMAIAVDPNNESIVYLSGDAGIAGVATTVNGGPYVPFTTILRGNIGIAPNGGIPSTHWQALAGAGTANGTNPHADSRGFAFTAAGGLLAVNDGGVYLHSTPTTANGDWRTLNSTLQTTEMHDVAVDPLSNMTFAGTQDNGTVSQRPGQFLAWDSIFGGDGGDVDTDFRQGAATSNRYMSSQVLICFADQQFDSTGLNTGTVRIPSLCVGGACSLRCTFPTPPKVGQDIYDVDPLQFNTRFSVNQPALLQNPAAQANIVIAGLNSVFETTDAGANVASLGAAPLAQNFAYGHPNNLSALWAITMFDGNVMGSVASVFTRLTAGGALAEVPSRPPASAGLYSGDIALSPTNDRVAYVVASDRVLTTPDAGQTWTDISGDLYPVSCGRFQPGRAGTLYAIEYVPSAAGDRLYVGGTNGVFMTTVANPTIWVIAGSNLPHALVWDMDRDNTNGRDDLVVGTLGRGAWRLPNASTLNRPPIAVCRNVTVNANAQCLGVVTDADINAGSFDPEGNPLQTFRDPGGAYGLNDTCVGLNVFDNNGAGSSCDAIVTVRDVTPPVISPVSPVTLVVCDPDGESVQLTPPTATDNCANPPTVTGSVIASSDPTLPVPRPVVNGSVVLGSGTHTIRWTASDGPNSVSVDQTVTTRPGIFATQNIDLRDRARVLLPNGTRATIMNSGTGLTHVGVQAQSGDIWSRARVVVDNNATISSFIRSMSTIQLGLGVSVGATFPNTPITFPPFPNFATTFTPVTNDVFIPVGGTATLAPGRYRHVTVSRNATLFVSNGQYWFTSLTIEPDNSFVSVTQTTQPVRLNVQQSLIVRGTFTHNPNPTGFLLDYLGTAPPAVERPFTGILAAPNAFVALGGTTFQTFTGQFYAQSLEVRPDVTVVCRKDF